MADLKKKNHWERGAINCYKHELPNFYVNLMLAHLTLVSSKNKIGERYLPHLIHIRKTHRFPLIYKISCLTCLVFSCVYCCYIKYLFCMNNLYFWRIFFLTDWRHKHLKDTIDLLLFYREHVYGFSESALQSQQKDKVLSYVVM